MNAKAQFKNLLVPIDFSPTSAAVFEQALNLASGKDRSLMLLHVIDASLIDFAVAHQLGTEEDVRSRMRQQAEEEMASYKLRADDNIEIDVIVSEGVPFLEILQKSEDFIVDAIVIGKVGTRGPIEKVLFGSTAEKVIRGSRRPVIVLPVDDSL